MAKKTQDLEKSFNALVATDELKLKEENKALKEQVNKLIREAEFSHKSSLIKNAVTPEEEICDMQIYRLNEVSRQRTLTLEETKMLDLHIKNKRLLEDKSTSNANYRTLPQIMSDDELLKVVEGINEQANIKKGSGEDPLDQG